MDYPLWAPKGNYTLLQDSNGIVIYDKDGKRIDIRGSNPEWAPSSSLLAYKSGKTGNPEIAELAGNSIKDTHPGPAISYTELEFSQDSSKIAYIESDGEKYSLHIADSHFGNIEGLLQSERAITNLRWHDNTLFFERQGIYKIEDKKMSSMISGGNMSFEISRNGKSILVNQYDKLYVMDLKTGNEELVAVPENGSIGNAIFTPDGHNVFYTVSLEHGIDAYLFNLKGQRTKLVSSLCSDFQSSDCYVQEMK